MRKTLISLFSILWIAIPLRHSFAEQSDAGHEKSPDLVIQFLDETKQPLHGVLINVFKIHSKNERPHFFFEDAPVDKDGRLSMSSTLLPLPAGTIIGIHSKDDHYCHYVKIEDVSIRNGIAKITVPITGIISATIHKYPLKIKHPVVVEAFKKNETGTYESFKGIGIFLNIDYQFEIPCLPTGIYKIQIKDDYQSRETYFEQEAINVVSGKKTDIGKISLK